MDAHKLTTTNGNYGNYGFGFSQFAWRLKGRLKMSRRTNGADRMTNGKAIQNNTKGT